MKNRLSIRRFTAFFLLCLLVFSAAPLPAAYAVEGDDDAVTSSENDSASTDTGDDSAKDSTDKPREVENGITIGGLHDPKIDATAGILINADTGIVLYEKNADEKRFPASTTKVMTALLTLEHVEDLNELVTAEKADFEQVTADSSNADIKPGEQIRVIDLLYAIMLPSANEASYILARHVAGSYEEFVNMMNAKAKELGCTGTHFSNPCGLHEDDHYSTARDLLKISQAAMQDETFRTIAETAQYRMAATNMHPERIIYTTNMQIFRKTDPWSNVFAKGIKTGHTSQAGNCLVSYAEKGKAKLYSVVLGCADAPDSTSVALSFTETNKLLNWGFDNFVSKTLAKQGESIMSTKVRLSTDADELVLTAKNDLVATLPKNIEVENLVVTPTVPESKDAPIKAGDPIGSITYSYAGIDYGTVELVALNDIERSNVLYYSDKLENFFKSSIFKIALVVLTIFFVLYVLFNLAFGGIRRRRQRQKMRSRYENTNYQRRRRR